MVLGDLLRSVAQRNPRGVGIVFEGKSFTWQELNERVNRFANALLSLGLTKGDRVAVYAQNSHWYAETQYALAKAGMVIVPINWQSAPGETAFILQNAEAKALVADDQYVASLDSIAAQVPTLKHLIRLGGDENHALNYEKLISGQAATEPAVEVLPDDVRGLGYTSGTTGNAKGCVVTHRQVLAGLANYLIEIAVPRNRATLLTVPFFTGYGSYMVYCAPYSRSTMVIHRQFNPAKVFEDVQRYKIAHMCVVPTMIVGMINSPDLTKYDLGSLQLIVYGGSVIAAEVLKRAMEAFKCGFCQVYGMQEAGGFVFFLTPDDHRSLDGSEAAQKKMLSCGRIAQFGQIRLIDGEGRDVRYGEHGELLVKSDATISGYYKNPEMTAQTIRDGWVVTGDIAYQDEEGYVYIADRKKDMIVSGGMNVYPAEVEAAIYKHPAVAQVAVIGVPDERWGEAVKAVIELKKGAKATEDEIIEFCKQHLASQKKPKSVDFVDALPVTNAGKVSKKEIRDKYWQGRERRV
jgi:acyl-CoA synthetase (AMP-forming)/AMP-acid ligase II